MGPSGQGERERAAKRGQLDLALHDGLANVCDGEDFDEIYVMTVRL